MTGNVTKTDVIKSDTTQRPASQMQEIEVASPPSAPETKRGVYQRIKLGLEVLGIGKVIFERERDDR